MCLQGKAYLLVAEECTFRNSKVSSSKTNADRLLCDQSVPVGVNLTGALSVPTLYNYCLSSISRLVDLLSARWTSMTTWGTLCSILAIGSWL